MQEYCKSSILYHDQTAQMTLRKRKRKEMCGFSGQFKKAQHFYSAMIENYSENFYLTRMEMEKCVEAWLTYFLLFLRILKSALLLETY